MQVWKLQWHSEQLVYDVEKAHFKRLADGNLTGKMRAMGNSAHDDVMREDVDIRRAILRRRGKGNDFKKVGKRYRKKKHTV